MELVLASSSPRRQELLRAARIAFSVQPANIPEEQTPGEAPQQFSERLAKEKASAVWSARGAQDSIVLAADTIVVVDDQVLGKPVDDADATRMLLSLIHI